MTGNLIGYEGGGPRDSGFYFHQRRQRKLQRQSGEFEAPTLELVFSRENLFRSFQALKQEGGQAPGIDGIRYDDLSPQEAGDIMAELSERILRDTWRPSETRPVLIPKKSSSERRELRIAVIGDRFVAKALHDAMKPLLEVVFLGSSYGFRPQRSVLHLLADLGENMERLGHWVVTEDDIRKAFDNVPVAVALQSHNQLFNEAGVRARYQRAGLSGEKETGRLLRLVKRLLGGPDQCRMIGIDQGSPYSPDVLNLVLHYHHDVPLSRNEGNPPPVRYADNLVSLSSSVYQGRQARSRSSKAIEAIQLGIKAPRPPANLALQEETELLGFNLRKRDDRLELGVPAGAWENLRSSLLKAHEESCPTEAATAIVRGWINSYGPAFESVEGAVHWLLITAAELGFQELDRQELLRQAEQARQRWLRARNPSGRRNTLS